MSEELEESTRKKYNSQFSTYKKFCVDRGIATDDPKSIAMHIRLLSNDHKSNSTIRGAVSAISNQFRHEKENPTHSSFVVSAKKAARKKAPAVSHRKPLLKAHLLRMSLKVNKSNFGEVRDFTMILLAFRGFLRGDEVIHLRADEVWIDSFDELNSMSELIPPSLLDKEILWLAVSSSKTNPQKQKIDYEQRSVENIIVGPDIDPRIDPLKWYNLLLKLRNANCIALFHRIDHRTNDDGGFLSTPTFNSIVKNRLSAIGVEDPQFGGHSARAGGATEAAKRLVETRLIKRHGRWKSDAVYIYIHDDKIGELHLNAALGGFTYRDMSIVSTDASLAVSSSSSNSSSSITNPSKPALSQSSNVTQSNTVISTQQNA